MRIFLCGAQGVGKSTLVEMIETNLEKKDSFSKEFLEEDSSVQTSKSDKYKAFQDKILLYCLNEYVNNNDFIASRSIIDSLAYLKANKADNTIPLFNLINHYRDYLLNEDDIYIYIPVEFEISKGNNQNREIDKEYQEKVDLYMLTYFERFRALKSRAKFFVIRGTVEERVKTLEEIIKKRGNV